MSQLLEVWLRGPLPSVPALLQPVAHALLQALEETERLMATFPDEMLWVKPVQMASAGFHLQHMAGVLNRLATYARGESLSEGQMAYLKNEGVPVPDCTARELVAVFAAQVHHLVDELKGIDAGKLTEARGVGRAQLPSTVIGLYVHAAEHTMRHLGQLIVTAHVVQAGPAAVQNAGA
jgi:hypothetical protein